MLGGHDFHTVPQRQPCETRMSVDAEGQGESSSLGSVVMVAVEVHSRPNTPDAARIASSQHVGASESVDTAPKCQKIPRRSTSFGSSAELEEEDVPVRTRPTTVGSPQHHSPFKSGHDTRTQRSLHGKHKVQTNNWPESSPKSAEAATSPGQDPSQGNGLEEQREDKYHHIWQDMRKELYQQNLVKLISRQRPGALGYIDKMSGLATGRKESLMSANFGYRIHFGDLQRIHIQYLHSKLVNLAVSAHLHDSEWRSGGKAEQIGQVMKEYIQAVKDHEYMGKYANASDDPFIATSQRLYDKIFLESAMTAEGYKMPEDFLAPPPKHKPRPQHETPAQLANLLTQHATSTGPWERDNTNKPAAALISTRTRAWKRAYWTRIGAALIGGAFLIAPMWILALQRNLFIHLGVATACITAFGFSISLYLEAVDGVFAATLAYAAVIMVFVGIVIEETGAKGT